MNNVFQLQSSIMNDYKSYVKSFINIKNTNIKKTVDEEISEGALWPEPLIQFNPAYQYGPDIDNLFRDNTLKKEVAQIFEGYSLYEHQVKALRLGCNNKDFVVTSGTGSGKSLTYIGTIFNNLLKRDQIGSGIQAVIVYPMNALINSQMEELNKYKELYEKSGDTFPITFAQYTGQESQQRREEIIKKPPDILLTNYMMLELILTRTTEHALRESIYHSLTHLVFDELHTYRGRQGSDVAMLIRRIKAKSENHIICIGTSATMVSGGTIKQQKQQVAKVASTLFGSNFESKQIINETLSRSLNKTGKIPDKNEILRSISEPVNPNDSRDKLKNHPLAIWLEDSVALSEKEGILVRNLPLSISEINHKLSTFLAIEPQKSFTSLVNMLQWISNVNKERADDNIPMLPFKLHQFISQTGSVYISLDKDEGQIITLEAGRYKGKGENKKPVFPVVFSRLSGYEFLCVKLNSYQKHLIPRDFGEIPEEKDDNDYGYIIPYEDIWDPKTDMEKLPDAWIRYSADGKISVRNNKLSRIPQKISYDEYGNFSFSGDMKYSGWFMSAKLLFDPTCGAIYDPKTGEYKKLTKLGSEGRSTSTTIITYSILSKLSSILSSEDQKILSFTDNRQDASLQAGHFNDFIRVVRLRAAIYNAMKNNDDHSLDYSNLGQEIFKALSLRQEEYATKPSEFPAPKRRNEQALQDYITYRALYDLRWGWRVVLPNLEQCALLEIDYLDLAENCSLEKYWQKVPYFKDINTNKRAELVYHILEYFRRSYSIHSQEYLTHEQIKKKRKTMNEKLKADWNFDKNEKIPQPYFMRYETINNRSYSYTASIGPQSALGKFLREKIGELTGSTLSAKEYMLVIKPLTELLSEAGWLKSFPAENRDGEPTSVYQLNIDQIVWKLGDEVNVKPDEVKIRTYKTIKPQPNKYFQKVYKTDFSNVKTYIGSEHTGQISNDDRKEREKSFRDGEISALFCSPTMELGIDIAKLNVVHMRNVPPNPANYAQRSGRAGRSGQAAFIFTYCSGFSPHDRHYFNYAKDMVAGVVAPPTLELTNEELLHTHLNAVYLAEIGLSGLENGISELLDINSLPELPIQNGVKEEIRITENNRKHIIRDFAEVIDDFKEELIADSKWFGEQWVERKINQFSLNFDKSFGRWRKLYLAAQKQLLEAQKIIESGRYLSKSREMINARRNLSQAVHQRELLSNKNHGKRSEFYPFRYLASEGFLPGYNFPRLPLSTYIPIGNSGEYISRSRFMALREFGPHNIIYHNGAKYRIEQQVISDTTNRLEKAKISLNSGYFLMGDEYDNEVCPFTGVALDNNNERKIIANLIEMTETKTEAVERISCEEEERISAGFDIETYFSIPAGKDSIKTAKINSGSEYFLKLQFMPTARLVKINTKWRIDKEEGFPLSLTTGKWQKKNNDNDDDIKRVKLFTTDTADALYIQPLKALALEAEGVITLEYALKRATEQVFQVESNEIGVCHMGDPNHPNILLYEKSEGSLGVMSKFVEDKDLFLEVVRKAYEILQYNDPDYQDPASYKDLLSYYNQRDHDKIDRFLIKDALEKLIACNIELSNNDYNSYDEHYKELMMNIDNRSDTEREFLNYLYKHNLKLPDQAQKKVEGIYVMPDFFYKPDIWIFCDGTPHDEIAVKKRDKQQREAIRNRGHQVLIYYYRDSIEDFIAKRPDIFRKVR